MFSLFILQNRCVFDVSNDVSCPSSKPLVLPSNGNFYILRLQLSEDAPYSLVCLFFVFPFYYG